MPWPPTARPTARPRTRVGHIRPAAVFERRHRHVVLLVHGSRGGLALLGLSHEGREAGVQRVWTRQAEVRGGRERRASRKISRHCTAADLAVASAPPSSRHSQPAHTAPYLKRGEGLRASEEDAVAPGGDAPLLAGVVAKGVGRRLGEGGGWQRREEVVQGARGTGLRGESCGKKTVL